jgi:hypothetical protein
MKKLAAIAFTFMLWQSTAPAQTASRLDPTVDTPEPADRPTGAGSMGGVVMKPEFVAMTASERWKAYFLGAFGPAAIARAALSGGLTQWTGNPKEWGGGAEAFGERFGNSLAEHIIRKTLESGAAAALHEDNRYVRSTESGFFRRSKHAVVSAFVARNEAGQEHFAYSRVGGALGASFISRIWQPPSTNSSGDAAANFGLTMVANMGWNVVKEFRPLGKNHVEGH